MHALHVLVLRMLVDTSDPHALRGCLRQVPDGSDLTFSDEKGLLALLHQVAEKGKSEDEKSALISNNDLLDDTFHT
jgi:hypothetical protein